MSEKHESDELSKIKKILADHEKRISALESLSRSKPRKIGKTLSIKEFILQKNPKNDVQKALVIGYYLEKFKSVSPFNAKDLEKAWREAREKVPTNIPDKIQKNIAKGHMMEAEEEKGGLKAWVLTSTGEGVVEGGFKQE